MKRLQCCLALLTLVTGCIADRTPNSEGDGVESDVGISEMDGASTSVDAEPGDVQPPSDGIDAAMPDAADMTTASQYDCPIPRISPLGDEFRAGDPVSLDGSMTTTDEGPGSVSVRYEWVVVERPAGSTSQPVESFFDPAEPAGGGPEDETLSSRAWFFVDVEGSYVFELRVTGGGGPDTECPDQDPLQLRLVAAGRAPFIEVVMSWENPEVVDDPGIDSNDVDLHLRHPAGSAWGTEGIPYDCHFMNPDPDWGELDNRDDDPRISNDANLMREERIFLPFPEQTEQLGGPYLVGAHYYSAFGRQTGLDFGPVDVRIRIRTHEGLLHDEAQRIDRARLLWEAAEIHVEDGAIRVEGLQRLVEPGN